MEVWSLSDVLLLLLAVCPASTVHFAACSQVFAAAQPSTTAHNKKCGLLLGAHLTDATKHNRPSTTATHTDTAEEQGVLSCRAAGRREALVACDAPSVVMG